MNKFQKEVMKKVKHDLITPFPFGFNGIDVSYYYVRKNSRISVKMYNKFKSGKLNKKEFTSLYGSFKK